MKLISNILRSCVISSTLNDNCYFSGVEKCFSAWRSLFLTTCFYVFVDYTSRQKAVTYHPSTRASRPFKVIFGLGIQQELSTSFHSKQFVYDKCFGAQFLWGCVCWLDTSSISHYITIILYSLVHLSLPKSWKI